MIAKAWNVQVRPPIGKQQPAEPPAELDYDAWLGPAPFVPFQANRHHYSWHWWYAFGTGDAGNDGVHELDIARWGLGVDQHPTVIGAAGGKYVYNDDQQFPDTMSVVLEYPAPIGDAAARQLHFEMRLWSRDATRAIDIDAHHTWFMPGMTCIKVYDEVTGEPRDSTRADLATITRIADGLDNIDAVCVACKDVPNSTLRGEIGEFLCMMENTTKPLEYLCEWTRSLEAAIEMAAALRGGRAELAEKPYFLHIVTPLPLCYAAGHVEQIMIAARAGVPLSVGTIAIGGASTPITTASTT